MRHYGIPKEIVMIVNMNECSSYKVMMDGCLTHPIEGKPGVIQGYILHLVMNFVMRKVEADTEASIILEIIETIRPVLQW